MTDCGICYEEMDDTNIAIFPCHANHKMHLTCYDNCVITGHYYCPFCRQEKKHLLKDINFYKKNLKIAIIGLSFVVIYFISICIYLYIQGKKVNCNKLIQESYIDISDTFLNGQCCVPNLAINGECDQLPNHVTKIVDIFIPKFNKICEVNKYNKLEPVMDYIIKISIVIPRLIYAFIYELFIGLVNIPYVLY